MNREIGIWVTKCSANLMFAFSCLFVIIIYSPPLFAVQDNQLDKPNKANKKVSINQQFIEARLAIKQGKLESAERILTKLIEGNPDLLRVRAELALLQVKTKQWRAAKVNLDSLLDTENLPPKVRNRLELVNITVEQELKKLNVKSSHRFNVSILASYGYDTDFALGNISELLLDDPDIISDADFDNYFLVSLSFEDLCIGAELANPCDEITFLLDESGQEAEELLETGIINQDGEFISYLELDRISSQSFSDFDDGGAFVRNQFNFRHIYTADDNIFRWRNQVNYTFDNPIPEDFSNKQLLRLDSELSWRLDDKWVVSGQLYFNDFKRYRDENFKYYGIQPEVAYLSPFGKLSLKADFYRKEFGAGFGFQQNSDYQSIGGAWSNYFQQSNLFLSVSTRFADSDSDDDFSDFDSRAVSVNSLYQLNDRWEITASISRTKFDFELDPSITVDRLITRVNYSLASNWHLFASWEYNRISNSIATNRAYRSTSQVGVQWQF